MKFLTIILATLLVLVGCVTVAVQPPATPAAYTWSGDVAKLNVVALDGMGTCSGWMITETELVTAGHCAEQLISVTACFYPDFDCKDPVQLTLRGADPVTDVAVLTLPDGVKRKPFPVRMSPITPGERVYAVGYPMGYFAVTEGLYSWRHPAEKLWDAVFVSWLQHSAPAAPGSSGGALLDADGTVVGMTIGARTFGPNIHFVFGIANPTDVIALAIGQIRLAPAQSATVGVIGPPVIIRHQ